MTDHDDYAEQAVFDLCSSAKLVAEIAQANPESIVLPWLREAAENVMQALVNVETAQRAEGGKP